MSLKLHLKPHEKIILGGAVIKCGNNPVNFFVENNSVAILRQKDIMTEAGATTPARRVYFVLQLMYIDNDSNNSKFFERFEGLEQEMITAAPSSRRYFVEIRDCITSGGLYRALKTARELIDYEEQLVEQANIRLPIKLPQVSGLTEAGSP
ncbi:flagellar biosynthesis repressor FlbT [Geobacter sp. AOG2]|uniref:flagellar biosynthesis repressor FlbT n=1 Tax=Geobacter sp. AOG2 TaxID=1566347 RepID=UPI001CC52DB6|nr:flagellar biosynthesis repressor FlbT [Geobacter sp. AOG2]GFE61478.1 putative flagellum biosynthesis repressor protein FlbT 1 [Geobacter sp. AOG2]